MTRSFPAAAATLLAAIFTLPHAAPCEQPSSQATALFNQQVATLERSLENRHRDPVRFIAPDTARALKAANGAIAIEKLGQGQSAPTDALIHHWRGTMLLPGMTAEMFALRLASFKSYPQCFAPDVVSATVQNHGENADRVRMRFLQRHGITVVLDAAYDVTFGQLDEAHGFSASRSVSIDEISSPGTREEHVLGNSESHGYLWRLNTYWAWEETPDGLLVQMETISLTRAVPRGLGWLLNSYVESIPRQSIEFTLEHLRAPCGN